MTQAPVDFGSSHRMRASQSIGDQTCADSRELVIHPPLQRGISCPAAICGGLVTMRMIGHVIYRMYLIVKAVVIHPFCATIVDFEKGTIEVEDLRSRHC